MSNKIIFVGNVIICPFFFACEDKDSRAEIARKNQVMVAHPRPASLPLCSVIVTLYYCCRYHFGEPEVLHFFKNAIVTFNQLATEPVMDQGVEPKLHPGQV